MVKSAVTVDARIFYMKIGELSKRTGCPIGTIRFYEMKGVLPGIARSMSGHRTYSAVDLERLRFIMDCRANGMKLECIRRFLAFRDDPSSGSEGLLESIEIYLEQVGRKRKELDRLEKYLNGIRRTLSGKGIASGSTTGE